MKTFRYEMDIKIEDCWIGGKQKKVKGTVTVIVEAEDIEEAEDVLCHRVGLTYFPEGLPDKFMDLFTEEPNSLEFIKKDTSGTP